MERKALTPDEIVDGLIDDCVELVREICKQYKLEENEKQRVRRKAIRHVQKLSLRTLEREVKSCEKRRDKQDRASVPVAVLLSQ